MIVLLLCLTSLLQLLPIVTLLVLHMHIYADSAHRLSSIRLATSARRLHPVVTTCRRLISTHLMTMTSRGAGYRSMFNNGWCYSTAQRTSRSGSINRTILRSSTTSVDNADRYNKISPSFEVSSNETLHSLYLKGCELLHIEGIEDSEDSSRYLISHVMRVGYRYSDFLRSRDKPVRVEEIEHFQSLCARRIMRVPIQYLVGNWDFYGLTLECRPPVLIPRPETEELVEYVLSSEALTRLDRPRVLDIGAGTGAIGIALLSQLPGARCLSIDINPDAVSLANDNAKAIFGDSYEQRYNCIHSDFLSFISLFLSRRSDMRSNGLSVSNQAFVDEFADGGGFDIVVSNPPYIPSHEIATLQEEVRCFEAHSALDGGVDGLDMVKDLILHSDALFSSRGSRQLWLEVSREHPAMIEAWLKADDGAVMKSRGVSSIEVLNDLSGYPRFVRITFSTGSHQRRIALDDATA